MKNVDYLPVIFNLLLALFFISTVRLFILGYLFFGALFSIIFLNALWLKIAYKRYKE